MSDFVDDLIVSWAENRPDLEVAPVGVTTRIGRVRDHIEGEMAGVFGSFGLTAPSFAMLATLTRLGGSASESQLAEALGLAPGSLAVRLDRLAADGLVERRPDGAIGLTPHGSDLAEQAVRAHLDNQARLLAGLTREEQAQLAGLLRKLLLALEAPLGSPPT